MSTGLPTLAVDGRNVASAFRVSGEKSATVRPADSQASTARMPGPPALVTTPTRPPFGSGWASRQAAMSNISSIVSARMTPDCRNNASTASSVAASAAVWPLAARVPACVRAALTATIGFERVTRRAIRANRRGLPNDSRYNRIARVPGSASQYSIRSLLETSALLPMLTNWDTPTPRSVAKARIAMPRAPLCEEKATRPLGGNTGAKDAFRRTAASVLSRPMQLGPTMRMPWPRTSLHELFLQHLAVAGGFREPGGDDHEGFHGSSGAVVDDREDRRLWHRHDREVHARRQIARRGNGRHALNLGGARMHGVKRSREAGRFERRQNAAPDIRPIVRGADDRD